MHKIGLPLVALCFCILLAGCSSNQPAPLNDDLTTEAITTTTTSDLQQQIDDLQSQLSELQSQLATTTENLQIVGGIVFSDDEWVSDGELEKVIEHEVYVLALGEGLCALYDKGTDNLIEYYFNDSDYKEINEDLFLKGGNVSGKIFTLTNKEGSSIRVVPFGELFSHAYFNISDIRAAGIIE